jgi:hypothetical protein
MHELVIVLHKAGTNEISTLKFKNKVKKRVWGAESRDAGGGKLHWLVCNE